MKKEQAPSMSTDLVVWGTNLGSTVGQGRLTKQIAAMIELPLYIQSIVLGLLLSDGWLSKAKASKNARLGFKQAISKSSYVWFVFNLLSHYCSNYPGLTPGIRAGNRFYGLIFFTRSLPCFTKLYNLFYPTPPKPPRGAWGGGWEKKEMWKIK